MRFFFLLKNVVDSRHEFRVEKLLERSEFSRLFSISPVDVVVFHNFLCGDHKKLFHCYQRWIFSKRSKLEMKFDLVFISFELEMRDKIEQTQIWFEF